MIIPRTTFHLSITRPALAAARLRAWLAQRDPLAILAVPILLLIVASAVFRSAWPQQPAAYAVPTPQLPIFIVATAQPPEATPAATAAGVHGHTLARAVVAYDAPGGNVIGAIDSGHAYRVVARYGVDWLQADVSGSGVVWLKVADVFDLPSSLADLQPPAAPETITVYVSAPPIPAPPAAPPAAALEDHPIVLDAAQQAAVDREFGLTDAERAAAFAEHQAREAAFAAGQAGPQSAPAADQSRLLTSEDLPCNCP